MMDEIDAAARKGAIPDTIPQYQAILKHLPYYIACVRETFD
jgi:hypothetical protein